MIKFLNTTRTSYKNIDNGRTVYYSYETPIAVSSGDKLYTTSKKYSKTTSKQISTLVAPDWHGSVEYISHEEFEKKTKGE